MSEEDYITKFEQFTDWMLSDLQKVLFKARSNFLLAQALFNYIEIMGSFLAPFSTSKARFNQFFVLLGDDYKKLTEQRDVYGELRCGLTHEYLPKKEKFAIANPDRRLSYKEIKKISPYGIKFDKGWEIRNARLYIDFRLAVQKYRRKLKNDKNSELRIWFVARCKDINLENF